MKIEFLGSNGHFAVTLPNEYCQIDREDTWFRTVGRFLRLRSCTTTDEELYQHYCAAGVGSRSIGGVRLKLSRTARGIGQCTFYATADPAEKTVCAPRPRPLNQKRSHCRKYRAAVESHWSSVRVFMGVLFNSLQDFKIANHVLSSAPSEGQKRRKRLRVAGSGVSLPKFSRLRHFTDDLIAWARGVILMGTCLCERRIVIDDIKEVNLCLVQWCRHLYILLLPLRLCTCPTVCWAFPTPKMYVVHRFGLPDGILGTNFDCTVRFFFWFLRLAIVLHMLLFPSPFSHQVLENILRDARRPAYVMPLHLVLWLDGTASAQRPLTMAKICLLDPSFQILPSGISDIQHWMECFLQESKIPLDYRQLMATQLSDLWRWKN